MARDARVLARAGAPAIARRMHKTPPRDRRGRFVALPTTEAPSWYVFSADGYRIPGEAPPEPTPPYAVPRRQPLPRAVAWPRRRRPTRAALLMYLVGVVGYIAMLWYGLHLPRPHR